MAFTSINDLSGAAASQNVYPMTKMSFFVTTNSSETAAFTEVTGFDASVDVIEFRQGSASTAAFSKLPGLVHHGNITFKAGLTNNAGFIEWAKNCVTEKRGIIARKTLTIDLYDIGSTAVSTQTAGNGALQWQLKNAWVTKLNMPDLDAKTSEVAIISMEVAYEEIVYPTFGTASSTSAPSGSGAS